MSKEQQILMESIDIIIAERLKNLKFNYYIEGIVSSINMDGTCNIVSKGETYELVKVRNGLTINTNDIVLICVVNNNQSNLFVDLIRP